jgi:hypothetical protein
VLGRVRVGAAGWACGVWSTSVDRLVYSQGDGYEERYGLVGI